MSMNVLPILTAASLFISLLERIIITRVLLTYAITCQTICLSLISNIYNLRSLQQARHFVWCKCRGEHSQAAEIDTHTTAECPLHKLSSSGNNSCFVTMTNSSYLCLFFGCWQCYGYKWNTGVCVCVCVVYMCVCIICNVCVCMSVCLMVVWMYVRTYVIGLCVCLDRERERERERERQTDRLGW